MSSNVQIRFYKKIRLIKKENKFFKANIHKQFRKRNTVLSSHRYYKKE